MTKLTTLSLALLFFLILRETGHGQELLISPHPIDDDGLDYAKVIGQTDEGVYVLSSNLSLESNRDRFGLRIRRYVIALYDLEKLQLKWKREALPEPSSGQLEQVGFFNESVILLTSTYGKTAKRLELFLSVIDSSGKMIKSGVRIYDGTVNAPSALTKPRQVSTVDNRWLGFVQTETGEDEVITHFGCIDNNFEAINSYSLTVPSAEGDTELSKFLLTDNLKLCFISQSPKDQQGQIRDGARRFRVHVADSDNHRSFTFNTESQPVNEAVLAYNRTKKLLTVTAFYAERGAASGTGLLFGKTDPDRTDSLVVIKGSLHNEASSKLTGQRHTGAGVNLYDYPVHRMIPRSDGGAIIIAEAAYLSEYSVFDYFTQTYNRRIEYHYDNVIILSVNTDATIDWSQVIRKEQTTLDDEGLFSSFCILVNADELLLLYNGELGRNNQIRGYSIDSKGQTTTRKFHLNGDNVLLLPRSGKQVSGNVIVAPAVTKKRLFLMKIQL